MRVATGEIETYANLDYYLSKPTPASRSLLLLLAYLGEPLQLMELQLIVDINQQADQEATSPWHQLDPKQLPERLRELQALGLVESEAETYSLLPALQERALATTPTESHATNRALLALALYGAAKFLEQQLKDSAAPALSRSMQRLSSLALRSALDQTDAELLAHCLQFYCERAMWARAGEAQQLGNAVEFWAQGATEQPMLAPLRGTLANLWLDLRLYPHARQAYQAILDDRSAHSHHGGVHYQIGIVYQEQRQWQQALEAYQRSLELYEQHGQQHEMSSTYHQIGMVYQEQRQWQPALAAYQRALELYEQHGQQHEAGDTHHQIGMVYDDQQQWQQALDAYQRALKLQEQHGQQHQMGITYHNIGRVYQEQRQWQQALDAYQRALELKGQHGQQHEMGSTHHQIGIVHQYQRQWQQALAAYQRALELQEQHGQQHELGSTYHQIGMVHQYQQQWQQALKAYQRALKLKEQHGQQHQLGGTYHQIGTVYEQQGELSSACAYYHRALAAERALDPPNPENLQIIQAALQRANCDQQNPQ